MISGISPEFSRNLKAHSKADPPCRFLDWDSEHFGFPIAQLDSDCLTPELIARANAWCENQSVRCLYFLADPVNPNLVALASQFSFEFVDARMSLSTTQLPDTLAMQHGPIHIGLASQDDLPALENLASKTHRNTRFFSDIRFPENRAQELYRKWVRKDVLAGNTLVARSRTENGSPLGYITIQANLDAKQASIGLVAVSEASRGKGVGTALVQAALFHAHENGARRISVVTQGNNVIAQRLYQVNGFRTDSCRYWYHCWLS